MDAEALQQAYGALAASNQWLVLWPELALGVLALVLLLLEIVLPRRSYNLIGGVGLVGQVVLFAALALNLHTGPAETYFGGMVEVSATGDAWRLFFLLVSILIGHLALGVLQRRALPRVEYHVLLLVITAAMLLLVQARHFVLLFVALETVTIGFYVLVSYFRSSPLSLEAGLKYLVLGALSSALLLFGIALLFGAASDPALPASSGDPFSFAALGAFAEANASNPLLLAGMVLVLAGVAFKIGAVPFQIWIPDVYQGAPTPTTAFLAVGSKAVGFALLLNLVTGPFASLQHVLVPLLSTLAILSVLFGNLAAVPQRNVKRILGLSGISHAGYLLMGVVATFYVEWAAQAVLFYLVIYVLSSVAVFTVMAWLVPAEGDDAVQTLDDYRALSRERPFLGTALAVGLGSLAGIPPLAGFIAKLFLFIAVYRAGQADPALFWLLAAAIAGVVISIYYYFGWIMAAFFRPPAGDFMEDEPAPRVADAPSLAPGSGVVLAGLTVATVVLGLYQGFLAFVPGS